MLHEDYTLLTQEMWDNAKKEYENRNRIPSNLTPEQAKAQFYAIARSALLGATVSYGNHIRKKDKLPPVTVRTPPDLAKWIEEQLANLDKSTGNYGIRSYHTIANAMLANLRDAENWFRNLHLLK